MPQTDTEFDLLVRVPFVTNRRLDTKSNEQEYYGGHRGELSAGYCSVGFENANDNKARVLQIAGAARADVIEGLGGTASDQVVVYLHGYNEGFDRSCRRAALLQERLRLHGRMLLFTWPADGNLMTYSQDAADMSWSIAHVREVLGELARTRDGTGTVVMAHSLGTRGVVEMLTDGADDGVAAPRFHKVILIAPDVKRERFFENIEALRSNVGELIVYASANDRVLWLSATVNASSRLGLPKERSGNADNVSFIDVSATATNDITGHLYHLYNPAVLEDLRRVLATASDDGAPGDHYRHYGRVPTEHHGFWKLQAVESTH